MAMPEISKSDYEQPRTAVELDSWRKAVHAAFGATDEGKNAMRLRSRPPIKEYCNEIWPLCAYAMANFSTNDDLLFCPVLGSQNFDALIQRRHDSTIIAYAEITLAHDDDSGLQDRLQREHLVEFGHTPQSARLTRPVDSRGVVRAEYGEFISLDEASEESLKRIKDAIARKYSRNYPRPTILIVEFSELHFKRESDIAQLDELCRDCYSEIQDKFSQLALVSDDHRIFKCYPVTPAWPT